jgi:hypothetical protein
MQFASWHNADFMSSNDIGRGTLLIRPSELSDNHTSSHLVANQKELAKKIVNLDLQSIFVNTSKGFLF